MSPVSAATATDRIRSLLQRPHAAEPTIYVLERARSRSNATQTVDLLVIPPSDDTKPVSISPEVALICGLAYDQIRQGVTVREPATVASLLHQLSARVFGKPDAFAVDWL